MASSYSGNPIVTAALAKMAMLRQADPSDLTLDLYSAELEEHGIAVEVIVRACEALQETPRREGETAFPDLGTLLVACRESKQALYREHLAHLAAKAPKALMPAEEVAPLSRDEAKAFVVGLRAQVEAIRGRR